MNSSADNVPLAAFASQSTIQMFSIE